MVIDRGPKVDKKLLMANTMLLDKNKALEYDVAMLEKKLKQIKDLCEILDKNYPEYKAYTSRIMFIIENNIFE